MQYKYLIIDAQNLYWRAVTAALKKCLDNKDDRIYTNSLQNFLDRVNELKNKFGTYESHVYLLFDNPLSIINKRKKIDIEYKHSREEKNVPKNFYKTLDMLQEILHIYKNNFYIIKCEGLEADDLVYPILQEINKDNKEENKIVISADMDWARALGVDKKAHWYNFVEIFTQDNFKNQYGFSPDGKKIQMFKAIHGDNSDAVPNAVPYLPREILLDIIERYNSIDDLLKDLWSTCGYPQNWKLKINEAAKRLKINYRLVDFMNYSYKDIFIFPCKENIPLLRARFEMNGLQLETRMFDKGKDNFFEKKKYRRIKNAK